MIGLQTRLSYIRSINRHMDGWVQKYDLRPLSHISVLKPDDDHLHYRMDQWITTIFPSVIVMNMAPIFELTDY